MTDVLTLRPAYSSGRRMRIPLQVAAALAVILLLAIVVSILSWQSYRGSRDVLLSAFDDTVTFIRDAVDEKIKRQLEPVSDKSRHALFHLRKRIRIGVVKGIVEVKDPGVDMIKGHRVKLPCAP